MVRQPAPSGPCFFILNDRLLWLDDEGKPNGREAKITLDVKAEPKRITLTPVGEGGRGKPSHGIYTANGTDWRVHLGLNGGAAPGQFLELNKPVAGVDGKQWLVQRKRLRAE